MRKVVLGISGASGAIYAKVLMESLSIQENVKVGLVFSSNAKQVWLHELGSEPFLYPNMREYDSKDFNAPFASGSSDFDAMIICPCSMGMVGRIANGISDDLLTRAADVMLKERRCLILATREMPYNLIHLENMKKITQAGGVVCAASPSFYSLPQTMDELVKTVTNRLLKIAGFKLDGYSWNPEY